MGVLSIHSSARNRSLSFLPKLRVFPIISHGYLFVFHLLFFKAVLPYTQDGDALFREIQGPPALTSSLT